MKDTELSKKGVDDMSMEELRKEYTDILSVISDECPKVAGLLKRLDMIVDVVIHRGGETKDGRDVNPSDIKADIKRAMAEQKNNFSIYKFLESKSERKK